MKKVSFESIKSKIFKLDEIKNERKNPAFPRWQRLVVFILILAVFLSSGFLFYKQAEGIYYHHFDTSYMPPHEIKYPGQYQTEYTSDLSGHIESALRTDIPAYTITKPLYRFIFWHLGGTFGIAILLAFFVVGAIWATKKLLDYYYEEKHEFKTWILAILLNFNIAIYLPWITTYFNTGVQEPNEWHNSTYTIMKFFALLAMLLYFKIEKNYLRHIDAKKYIIFTILLLVVNAVKPTFIIAFAPAMLLFFIIDFFKNVKTKKAILNIVIFGCSVLISLTVLIYQSKVLYGTGENSDGSGIAISVLTALKMYHPYPLISILQSAAFPLFILFTNLKTVLSDRKHSFVLVMNVVALSLYLFFAETGPRAGDGNFDWSYTFTLMMAFISSVSILRALPKKKTNIVYLATCYILLGAHIISGLIYYGVLLTGGAYN